MNESKQNSNAEALSPHTIAEKIESYLTPVVAPIGYEIVHLEAQLHRPKTIRIYIDRFTGSVSENAEASVEPIGVEDCAKVSRAVDEPLEAYAQSAMADANIAAWLSSGFELEVSSPGVDRPLRKEKDFRRFAGREIRLSTFRPLSETELKNPSYFQRNPKQKNYFGELCGFQAGEIVLKISASMGSTTASAAAKPGAKKSKNKPSKSKLQKPADNEKTDTVHIPLSLVSKANLEPRYDLTEDSLADGEPISLDGPEADFDSSDTDDSISSTHSVMDTKTKGR